MSGKTTAMTELEQLHTVLRAIPGDQLRVPSMSMAVALQEAHDLHARLLQDDTWNRLLAIGVEPDLLDQLVQALAAMKQAQSQWILVARERGKPKALRERRAAGLRLRTELLAACRWNLRGQPQLGTMLDHVIKGQGTPDLVQDLHDLATIIEHHRTAFDRDESFDAPQQAEAAHALAHAIATGEGRAWADQEPADLKRLRDQAYTHLARLVTHLREAGRYAFRNEPQRAAGFASAHRRTRERKRRRATGAAPNEDTRTHKANKPAA
ncbi:MAG: hypothetical protein AAGF11_30345 [Myxococcota bacterium]